MTIESAIHHLRPRALWTLYGDSYSGLVWQDPQQTKPTESEVAAAMLLLEPVPVPAEVSLRQFLMASDRFGLLATLEALKTSENIPQQMRRDIHFFLEYSNFIERNHPLIAQLAPVIGVSESQIDDIFRTAATL